MLYAACNVRAFYIRAHLFRYMFWKEEKAWFRRARRLSYLIQIHAFLVMLKSTLLTLEYYFRRQSEIPIYISAKFP